MKGKNCAVDFLLQDSYSELTDGKYMYTTTPLVENGRVTSITFMKFIKFVLAAQNIDVWLNIFHDWLEFMIVSAGLVAHGCSSGSTPSARYFFV